MCARISSGSMSMSGVMVGDDPEGKILTRDQIVMLRVSPIAECTKAGSQRGRMVDGKERRSSASWLYIPIILLFPRRFSICQIIWHCTAQNMAFCGPLRSTRTIPLQARRTGSAPADPCSFPSAIHNRTRQTHRPLRVLFHSLGNTLRRNVE